MTQRRIFVLGDSIAIYFGPFLEKELAGKYLYDHKRSIDGRKASDNWDFPQGESGGDSSMCLGYLRHRRMHDPIKADVLLINCGLHDIKTDIKTKQRQVSIEQYESNLKQILAEAAAMKLAVVWLRTAPVIDEIHNTKSDVIHRFAADVDAYNRVADAVMTAGGAHVIDFHGFCRTIVPEALIDHVHYSEPGCAAQAAFIAGELERLFGIASGAGPTSPGLRPGSWQR